MMSMTRHGTIIPSDFEECGECGFDHEYEPAQAAQWHRDNPCSYCHFQGGKHGTNCPTISHKETKAMFYSTIFDIKRANRTYSDTHDRAYWFDPPTMSFFSTKLCEKVYGGRYFITSEQYEATDYGKTLGFKDGDRAYSVRVCRSDGSIDTVGDHMKYKNHQEAEKAVSEVLLLTNKYLHTPSIPGYGDTLMVLECADREVIERLKTYSIDRGKKNTFHMLYSGAEVGVWEFNPDKFAKLERELITTHSYSKVQSREGIELVTPPLK